MVWTKKGDYARVIQDYTEAIRLDPKNADLFTARGHAWHEKKEYGKAIQDYDSAIGIDARCAIAFYAKACCFALKKRSDLAIENLRRSLELGFLDLNYIEKHNDLKSIRGDRRYQELLQKYKAGRYVPLRRFIE